MRSSRNTAKLLSSKFVNRRFQIFSQRYYGSLLSKVLQSYKLSTQEDDFIVWESSPGHLRTAGMALWKPFYPNLQFQMACDFATPLPKETHLNSLKRSRRQYQHTFSKETGSGSKIILFSQSNSISIVLIYQKGWFFNSQLSVKKHERENVHVVINHNLAINRRSHISKDNLFAFRLPCKNLF